MPGRPTGRPLLSARAAEAIQVAGVRREHPRPEIMGIRLEMLRKPVLISKNALWSLDFEPTLGCRSD
jgi:hypothetical protein